MITVHSLCFNEEHIIGFMIDHYRARFPACEIVIHDNESTDGSVAIARARSCVVVPFSTGGTMDDVRMKDLRNSCWKESKTDWVLVCDADELLDIDEAALREEDAAGTTIIRSRGFNMVNMKDDYDLGAITHGAECDLYSKSYLFKKSAIPEINYWVGSHESAPVGVVVPSRGLYPAYHFRHIHPELSFRKQNCLGSGMSDVNRQYCYSYQYMQNKSLADIRAEYDAERAAAQPCRRASLP